MAIGMKVEAQLKEARGSIDDRLIEITDEAQKKFVEMEMRTQAINDNMKRLYEGASDTFRQIKTEVETAEKRTQHLTEQCNQIFSGCADRITRVEKELEETKEKATGAAAQDWKGRAER